MLLKKQTVWLLTMLSLVVVLSVYYVFVPPQGQNDLAATGEEENKKVAEETKDKATATGDQVESKTEEAPLASSGDETFEMLRMEMTDERNKLVEELVALMGNTELSAKERVQAQETIKDIQKMTEQETTLESMIVSMNEKAEAALVRAEEKDVIVTVKAAELSKSAANDIIRLVSSEIPTAQNVRVELQPAE
ncbi:MAG: SpoIIIAH-like family protein [Bacillus sp. (in: firmicutes)]